jgi:ATP-dependent DNA helicase PIF1
MLLRNLNQNLGLCNGTRLMVQKLGDNVIEASIITGSNIGDVVYIPRIVLSTANPKWPFVLHRRQFPIQISYAMTINRSQEQTLSKVGVYLRACLIWAKYAWPSPPQPSCCVRYPWLA